MRIAIIGHVEHVTIARAAALPRAGDIVHLDGPVVIAGGGGGIAFFQLTKGDAELHLFTAIGLDEAGTHVHHEITGAGATVHAALRQQPHTRDIVVITPDGERTIFVVGEPLHPGATTGFRGTCSPRAMRRTSPARTRRRCWPRGKRACSS